MKLEQFLTKKWRKQPMKEAKKANSSKPIFEVQMSGKSNKRLMAYATARSNLTLKKKEETSK